MKSKEEELSIVVWFGRARYVDLDTLGPIGLKSARALTDLTANQPLMSE